MTPDGPFIKLEGKDMIFHASENVVLKGFVPKKDIQLVAHIIIQF